jgi:RNA polymerase sigma-70 factor (ECF subfamily)
VTPRDTHDGDEARRALTLLLRESGRDVLATLIRVTGDLALAEDAVQDATLRALETWPRDGVPKNPVAWLRLTARNRAIDIIRRESGRQPKEEAAMTLGPTDLPADEPTESMVEDDLLRLIFTCCHPSLAPATQVALALRTLCGLTTAEVARALVVPEATMSKRLTRAKEKIRLARIPYRVPADHELPDRWAAVLATAYLLFNEGYAATAGPALVRGDVVDEALRLTRLLVRLQPDDPGAIGLLALMLLQDSRREARVDARGGLVLLPDQDRSRWDQPRIREAVRLVGEGLRRSADLPNRYVVQAAIASCHALAPAYESTDWDSVVSWYDVLLTLDDGPVVRLNRAVAVAESDGADAGLALVDRITGLEGYALWHATRAVLLRRLGRADDAATADACAVALPLNDVQRRLLQTD